MPRVIKQGTHDLKRRNILDAALKLIYEKGYEDMSVQDILEELDISKGALYHYYDSKQAILDALIKRMATEIDEAARPILENDEFTAIQKLREYFDVSMRWKQERVAETIPLLEAWYDEKNDLVRQRLAPKIIAQQAKTMEPIIRQGIAEGVFMTRFPEEVAILYAQLTLGVGETIARFVLTSQDNKVITTIDAYIDTVERMLGLPSGTLGLSNTI